MDWERRWTDGSSSCGGKMEDVVRLHRRLMRRRVRGFESLRYLMVCSLLTLDWEGKGNF